MNESPRLLFVSLLAVFLLAGCDKSRTVEGQVFIATAGGNSTKLGAVTLYVVPASEMTNRIQKLQSDFKIFGSMFSDLTNGWASDLAKLIEQKRELEREYADIDSEYASKDDAYHNVIRKWMATDLANLSVAARKDYDGDKELVKSLLEEKRSLKAKRDDVDERRSKVVHRIGLMEKTAENGFRAYFAPLMLQARESWLKGFDGSHALANGITDADGRYRISFSGEGRFFLVGTSKRYISENRSEEYAWAEEIPTTSRSQLMLNNNNVAMPNFSPFNR